MPKLKPIEYNEREYNLDAALTCAALAQGLALRRRCLEYLAGSPGRVLHLRIDARRPEGDVVKRRAPRSCAPAELPTLPGRRAFRKVERREPCP
jgi:hypothetical protein